MVKISREKFDELSLEELCSILSDVALKEEIEEYFDFDDEEE